MESFYKEFKYSYKYKSIDINELLQHDKWYFPFEVISAFGIEEKSHFFFLLFQAGITFSYLWLGDLIMFKVTFYQKEYLTRNPLSQNILDVAR